MRATSQDYDTASLMGVNVNQIISYTFALGSALAAAGGILVGVYFNAVFPLMGLMTGMKAFAAAVLGGIGSIPGAVLGALLLGNAEVFTSAVGLSSYKDAVAFGILILVLLIKPTGLMGRELHDFQAQRYQGGFSFNDVLKKSLLRLKSLRKPAKGVGK